MRFWASIWAPYAIYYGELYGFLFFWQGIGGAKRLTKAAMLSIQGHYGNAIRSNPENAIKMSSDIWAIYLHRRGNHTVCLLGVPVTQVLVRTLQKLISISCQGLLWILFGQFSKNSASLNCSRNMLTGAHRTSMRHSITWYGAEHQRKTVFVNRPRLTLATAEAVIVLNDGELGRIPVFEKLWSHWTLHPQHAA